MTRYPLYRRLGGPQGRSGQVRKISPPPGFNPRTVQPVASGYTDWAIAVHCYQSIKEKHVNNRCILNVLYECPDDDSLRIETCSNAECLLINWVAFYWSVFIVSVRSSCPSVLLSSCIGTALTGRIFLKFEIICRESPNLFKIGQYRSIYLNTEVCLYCWEPYVTFCSLTAVQKGAHYCSNVTALSNFILLTNTCEQQYEWKTLLRFPRKNIYANAPQCYIMRTLPILLKKKLRITVIRITTNA